MFPAEVVNRGFSEEVVFELGLKDGPVQEERQGDRDTQTMGNV